MAEKRNRFDPDCPRKGEEMIEIQINECPKGRVDSTCKTEECVYQEGKWKGDFVPTFSISERKENGKYDITCDDETE